MIFRELTNEEFTSFAATYNASSIYQSVPYMEVMKNQGFQTLLLGLIDNNNILGATMVLIEKKNKVGYGYVPRGFLIDYNNFELLSIFTKEIKKYLSKKNIISIKICPPIVRTITDMKYNITNHNNYYDNIWFNLKKLGYKHLGYNNYFEALKPRFEAIIDINLPYYILFKNIKKEFRTKIRSAEGKGIKIYKGNIDNIDILYEQIKSKYPRNFEFFKDIYVNFNKVNKGDIFFAKLDTKYYLNKIQEKYINQESLCKYLNTMVSSKNKHREKYVVRKMAADNELNRLRKELVKATKYLQEHPEGIIIATSLVLKNNDEIFILTDGVDKKYKSLNPKHLLIWKLMEMYSKKGFKKINMSAMSNPNIEDNKFEGLNTFKINFNALSYEYLGDLELVCNDKLNFLYNNFNLKNILKI